MPETFFKYRPILLDGNGKIDEKTIRQVIEPIASSYYYLPTRQQLNDPTEGVFDNQIQKGFANVLQIVKPLNKRDELSGAIDDFSNHITHSTDNSGIFSLSRTPSDEIMWAHYANSHCGIVIEYDIDLLTRFSSKQHLHCFDVRYSTCPPTFILKDFHREARDAITTMLGHKSPKWVDEEEYRLVMDNTNGEVPHDYRAVKSITFGVKVPECVRTSIYDMVKEKVPDFYEIKIPPRSYHLKREILPKYKGSVPNGIVQKIDWKNYLQNIKKERGEELIEIIQSMIESDPHYKELFLLDISTVDASKVVVSYTAKHYMQLQPGTEYTKLYLSL